MTQFNVYVCVEKKLRWQMADMLTVTHSVAGGRRSTLPLSTQLSIDLGVEKEKGEKKKKCESLTAAVIHMHVHKKIVGKTFRQKTQHHQRCYYFYYLPPTDGPDRNVSV